MPRDNALNTQQGGYVRITSLIIIIIFIIIIIIVIINASLDNDFYCLFIGFVLPL